MSLVENIKESEGFRGEPYNDTLGFATVGYGTKLPLDEAEAEMLLKRRLTKLKVRLHTVYPTILHFDDEVKDVLYEMAYQMGVVGLLKFKKMFKALEDEDYAEASYQGLDSLWAKQTPNRANKLMDEILKLKNQ